MTALLRTEQLKKYFGEVHATDRVDLALEPGVLTAIIGPNGAGKTTFINLLTGLMAPDSGRIFFKEEDITRLPTHMRVKRGLCRSFQIMNIFPQLTVFQNVLVPVLAAMGKGADPLARLDGETNAGSEASAILAEFGFDEKAELLAGQLSHGDQRLLEMSIAVASKPVLCFLDEPTSGTNPVERTRVLDTIKRLSTEKQTTFVIVEHDMDVVFALAERVIVMNRGQILTQGPPQAIKEDKEVREIYLGEEV